MSSQTLIELDARKRAPLGRIAQSDRYLVTVEAGGRIILDPAVVMTASQAELLSDPSFHAQVAASLASAEPDRPARQRPQR